MTEPKAQPLSKLPHNVRMFLLFRVFFNARYYYPIFALLFLDLGLTLEQFSAVNAVWALTIVRLAIGSRRRTGPSGQQEVVHA